MYIITVELTFEKFDQQPLVSRFWNIQIRCRHVPGVCVCVCVCACVCVNVRVYVWERQRQ